jgi:transcriptional regulator with XRE-family HTH domain
MMNYTNETLGQFIERVARQKGINFHDIERNCDGKISNSYVSKIVNGEVDNPTVDKIVALAVGMGISPFDILEVMCGQSPATERRQSLDAQVFVDLMHKVVINPGLLEIVQLCSQLRDEDHQELLLFLRYQHEKASSQPKARSKKITPARRRSRP